MGKLGFVLENSELSKNGHMLAGLGDLGEDEVDKFFFFHCDVFGTFREKMLQKCQCCNSDVLKREGFLGETPIAKINGETSGKKIFVEKASSLWSPKFFVILAQKQVLVLLKKR